MNISYQDEHIAKYEHVIGIINHNTTREQFLNNLNDYPFGTNKSYDSTLLSEAASYGNLELIDCILEITGTSLLSEKGNNKLTPLNSSIFAAGENWYGDRKKTCLGAKKLIQLGASTDSKSFVAFGNGTSLYMALNYSKANGISLLLLRRNSELSGCLYAESEKAEKELIMEKNLNAVKKELMTDQEKLLKLGSQSVESTLKVLPEEVINTILSISAKLI